MRSKRFDGLHVLSLLDRPQCPSCREELFAAEGATWAVEGVRFGWSCDICGHKFETQNMDEPVAA